MVSDNLEQKEKFREEVRTWLKENLPKGWGTPEYVAPVKLSPEYQEQAVQWRKKRYDAGYTGFDYPREYGGIERPAWQISIINEEMARTGTPPEPMSQGLLMVAPTIMACGTEWQKKRFIPKILSGEESWCQGFSEPDAGSDLANVRTTAVRDGDDWVVNGQKVWTSNWPYAHFGLLVIKTDPDAPRHHNLSYFIFDCSAPGFSRRPLRQMSGESEFGEMFFDNMRIPHDYLIGELGDGWRVALTSLSAERSGGSGETNVALESSRPGSSVAGLVNLARSRMRRGKSVWDDPVFKQRIAQFAIMDEAVKYRGARLAAQAKKGLLKGNEQSVGKNRWSEIWQSRSSMVTEIIGAYSQLVQGSDHALSNGQLVYDFLRSRGSTIEMGSWEINRNIIAERILGLPRK